MNDSPTNGHGPTTNSGTNGNGGSQGNPLPPPFGRVPLSDSQMLLNRFEEMIGNASMLRSGILQQLMDPRRSIEDECGYPRSTEAVGVELYRQLYDRELGWRVVQVLPKESWQVSPQIYEDEDSETATPFEQAWDDLELNVQSGKSWHQDEQGGTVWEHLLRADILSRIGHFGVLMLGIDDGKNLQDPVDGVIAINHRYEFVKNSRGEVIDVKTIRERHSPMPDSGTLASNTTKKDIAEIKTLREMIEGGKLRSYRGIWDKAGYRKEEVIHEAAYLNDPWPMKPITSSASNPDSSPTVNALAAPDSSVLYQDGWGAMYGSGFGPGVTAKTPTNRATKLDGGERPGTDSQYAWQQQAPAALSGTDQQYFGVQFGASEAFPPDDGSNDPSNKQIPPNGQKNAQQAQGPNGKQKPGKPTWRLLFLRAFDESLIQVVRWEWNIRNPRFGMPVMYRITLNDPREQHTGIGLPLATIFVHWSRVIHLADNLGSSEVMGVPAMRPVLNRILDCRKLYSGSAEMYWRGAFPGWSLETNPQMGPDVIVDKPGIRDMMEQWANGLQRYMVLTGMQAKSLAPQVVDPSQQIDVQITAICIQLGIPKRVFMGSERGELASSQDDSAFNDRIKHRQQFYLTPKVIVPFIDRLIALGVLPEPSGYTVAWPDIESMTDKDKAGVLLTRTQAYAAYVSGGLEATIPPIDYMTRFDDMEEEEATEIIEAAQKAHEQQETMTMPPQIAGHDVAPPEGSAAHQDQKQQAAQLKAMTDLKAKQVDQQGATNDAKIAAMAKTQATPKSSAKGGGSTPPMKATINKSSGNMARSSSDTEMVLNSRIDYLQDRVWTAREWLNNLKIMANREDRSLSEKEMANV